jgi:hypothetical protein
MNDDDQRPHKWIRLRHPQATFVGSTLVAGIVGAAASVLGASALGFAASVAVAIIVGGWAGGRIGRHREQARLPREAVRRRRRIRVLRITRTLRRRKLGRSSPTARPEISGFANDHVRRPA